jgi:predicted esterase
MAMPDVRRNMQLAARILKSLLRIVAGVPIVSLTLGSLLYLVLSVTWPGRCVALSGLTFGVLLFCSIGYWNRPWFVRIRCRLFAILLPISLIAYLVPLWLAPSDGNAAPRVQSRFLHGKRSFWRCSPSNVMPEVDQINVAMTMCPLFAPQITPAEGAKIRSLTRKIYEDMARDPAFRDLGSALDSACLNLLHVKFARGHYFVALPDEAATSPGANQRLPCLIFLHGMGGNAKACLWLLSRWAREKKCVVIAPTFGLGNWDNPDAAPMVVAIAHEAINTLPIDPHRIYLMGYSNGAMGVTRAAILAPELFQGLIYLSPVTEDQLFMTKEFLARAHDRKILFLHGGRDGQIPRDIVEGTARTLKQRINDVRIKVYDDESHWLLFSRPESVMAEVFECMTAK